MNLNSRLKSFFRTVLNEAETNPEFARKLSESLGLVDRPQEITGRRKGRRNPAKFDPFEAYDKDVLQPSLDSLSLEELKDMIAEHRMDRTTKAMKWKTKDKLIPLIVKTVEARSRKGDAFRLPVEASKRQHPLPAGAIPISILDSPTSQEMLRASDVIVLIDPTNGFAEQVWGQHSIAAGRAPGASPHEIKTLEIALDSDNPTEVQRAKLAVEAAKRNSRQ
jgi:hypothetical protein